MWVQILPLQHSGCGAQSKRHHLAGPQCPCPEGECSYLPDGMAVLVHGGFPRDVLRRAPGRSSVLTKGRGCYLSLKRLSLLTGRLSQLVLSAY